MDPLRMQCGPKPDRKATSLAQAINLSKIAIIHTQTVWRKATFRNTTQSLYSYVQTSKEDYGVHLVEALTLHVVDAFLPSSSLAFMFGERYMQFTVATVMMINSKVVLLPIINRLTDTIASETLGITNLNDANLFI